jgi:beta-phosphoglucomutase-like phosphatase (HAD superfamily)
VKTTAARERPARSAWPEPPVDLNRLTAHWRVALGAAHDALAASARCPRTLDDIRIRDSRLKDERAVVAALLDADARVEHVRLVRSLTQPSATRDELGLATDTLACIFDLDGVLTASADIHFAAWADTFDEFLARRLEGASVHFSHYARFSRRKDYVENIHGKPRLDGVRAFLASRGITLPEGTPEDAPGTETVWGLANRKNQAFHHRLEAEGVNAFAGSVRYLQALVDAGLSTVVVSASAHTEWILEKAGMIDLVGYVIDGNTMQTRGLQPMPAPDTLQAACEQLAILPRHAAAFETTAAGVAAARSAAIGLLVGVDRSDDPGDTLGADIVVGDLTDLLHPRLTR